MYVKYVFVPQPLTFISPNVNLTINIVFEPFLPLIILTATMFVMLSVSIHIQLLGLKIVLISHSEDIIKLNQQLGGELIKK